MSAIRKPSAENGGLRMLPDGPWGSIGFHHIYLEASEYVASRFSIPSTTTRWSFEGATTDRLQSFFEAAGIDRQRAAGWLQPARVVAENHVLHVLPPSEHVEALSPPQRAIIYRELGKSELNEFHCDPVYIRGGSAEEFLRATDVAPEHKAWFGRMCYTRGKTLCFSDFPALLARARSDAEAVRLFKLATRTRAVMARLRLGAGTDAAQLVKYWSDDHRNKDLLSMLLSLVGNCPPDGIDLLHILPPTARKLMNTYPSETLLMHGRMPDCHWSSLNFFNHEPREYFLNTRLASYHVLERYEKVAAPYRYGDVLVFSLPSGDAVHSCVYLAGDLVFTKNGENAATPWIMTQLRDLQSVYVEGKGNSVVAYRQRVESVRR